MTEWNLKKQIEFHDTLYQFPEDKEDLISDPTKLLFTLIKETESWAYLLEIYDGNYINQEIQQSERICSDKRFVYINVAGCIDYDMNQFITMFKEYVRAMLRHKSVVSSMPEVLPTILEELEIFQLLIDKGENAYDSFKSYMKYESWDFRAETEVEEEVEVPVSEGTEDKIDFEDCNKAFAEITKFTTYIKQSRFSVRLAELAHILKVYCGIDPGGPELLKTINRQMGKEEIESLLDSDVVQAIVKVLGTKKLKRVQIVRGTEYEDGGHMGSTLIRLTRIGFLQHKRPYYCINHEWYDRLGICPDKDGQ